MCASVNEAQARPDAADGEPGLAEHDDCAARMAVGERTGGEREHQDGHREREADQAEAHRRVGALIDFPTDGDDPHLVAGVGEERANQVEQIAWVAQRRDRIVLPVRGSCVGG